MSKKILTKKQVEVQFRHILDSFKTQETIKGSIDWGARQLAWTHLVDYLQKDGQLNERANRWDNPSYVVPPWRRSKSKRSSSGCPENLHYLG